MSLFVKATWRRYHVEPEELRTCWDTLTSDKRRMFSLSALAGRAHLVMGGEEVDGTIGINPPAFPQMDAGVMADQEDIDRYLLPHLAANLKDAENTEPWEMIGAEMPEEVAQVAEEGWGADRRDYRLFDERSGMGFWLVAWAKQDLVDKPSLREARCAAAYGTPYKLLSNDMKKALFGSDEGWDVAITRKQVPVILDLTSGDIWLGSGSTKFAKALATILAQGGLLITAGELQMGHERGWVQPAINAIRDKDLYKLERQEAIEREIAMEQQLSDPNAMEEDETTPTPPRDPAAEEQAKDDHRYLSELGTWAPDEGGEVLTLMADASVALSQGSSSAVATVSGRDALELFVSHPNAELVGCSGVITIPPPPADAKGNDLARITIDFTSELAQGIYRNLEFTGVGSLWNELLEAPYANALNAATVVDSEISSRTHATLYSRYWFRYYLMLQEFERCLIDGFARVLELDPSEISVQSRSLFANTEPATKANEDVKVSSEKTGPDDFLDSIPFAVD
jgi:hypothetical protein